MAKPVCVITVGGADGRELENAATLGKTRRVIVGRTDEFPDGRGTRLQIDGLAIALFRVADRVFAVANRCPHRGFPLHDGRLKLSAAGVPQVQCRTHGAIFDLETGNVDRGPARRELAIYGARIVGDQIEVEIPGGTMTTGG